MPSRKAPEEMQQLINDMTGPSAKKIKKVIRINRRLVIHQEWELEVMMAENEDLQEDIIRQIQCEGMDWGQPTDEVTDECDDEMEVE